MNYSFLHKHYAACLNYVHNINEQNVLDHPENYLGPNYKEVLNFWFYWESLSDEQKSVYWERWWTLDHETWKKARKTAVELAKEVIDPRFVRKFCGSFGVEPELIAAHLYIERNIPFTFLPLIFDL